MCRKDSLLFILSFSKVYLSAALRAGPSGMRTLRCLSQSGGSPFDKLRARRL
jgi:hypothetical protein